MDLCNQYLVYARAEESLAKQKSRIQWLKDQTLSDYFGSSRVNQLITKKPSHSRSLDMVLQETDKEIKDTFWSLNPQKSPGPDGYNAAFFHKAWHVIGHGLILVVKLFFKSGQLLKKANATLVTLELMRVYHKHSSSPRCAMKVDIMKAYDNVKWDLLRDVLISMNFHPKMIQWLKACVSTANYCLCFNGEAIGHGGSDLHPQGEVSPPDFKFHWKCGSTKLVNLCFADDLMIFCKGEVSSITLIKQSLTEFETLSGLSPSPTKSNIFFSGVNHTTKSSISNILGFQEGSLLVRYLGVPLLSTKLKHTDCKVMVDRIVAKTKSWTNRYLSYAGRIQLIKSILFSMQTYWSSLFIIPKMVIKEIELILRAFFSSCLDLKKSGAKVSWEHPCTPVKEGGLGFKSLEIWNKAAVAKHIWFLVLGGEQSMWCQWVKSYLLRGKSFWSVKTPSDPSWVWRKILNLRPYVQPHIKYKIGDGQFTYLWFDNWHPLGHLLPRFGPRIVYDSGLPKDVTVKAIVRDNQ
ncbi:uncharacterized protein LOC131321190 [Rhododendron vialii]|uniref:uncharacterized protein LOC131321190 n=1 Tax=Rhododendron vialii TaxID=182163 RepID=UPI00265EEE95|nr:uncharacterized protein LOC131321190 [Rhododendron vialii]